jgi:hypothetical protein
MLHGLHNENKIQQNSGNSRIFFPHKFELPFPSSSELATQDAADLTHALLNPQPEGPFCQVGDEQAIALRRLANIFEAARLLIPQVRPAHKYPNSPWEMIHPPGGIMQYVCDLTRSTRMGVPSHSQPLINAKYQFQVTNYLQNNIITNN